MGGGKEGRQRQNREERERDYVHTGILYSMEEVTHSIFRHS